MAVLLSRGERLLVGMLPNRTRLANWNDWFHSHSPHLILSDFFAGIPTYLYLSACRCHCPVQMKLLHVLILVLCVTARSATTIEREFTCPLDHQHWKQRIESSGRAEALRLDSREIGRDVVQPPTIPQCPVCHCALVDSTLDESALRRLRTFVSSADYKNLAAKNNPHACLATIQEIMGAPPFHVGFSYLRASWAAEASEARCRQFLLLARSHFIRALEQMKPEGKDYINLALMCGEIERRTERWEEATARFSGLLPVISVTQPKYELIVTQQLALITRHDSRPHIVGAHPDAPPAMISSPATSVPRIALRDEPPTDAQPQPKTVSKVPDLARPFIGGNGDAEPLTIRPFKLPAVGSGGDLPKSETDPALADSPPDIEVQRIPDGLPDAEPLPEPIPIDKPVAKPVKKPKGQPENDKKNVKPKGKPAP